MANKEGSNLLPKRAKGSPTLDNDTEIDGLRKESVSAAIPDIQARQKDLHAALADRDEKKISETLKLFESKSSSDSRSAWNFS